jgi:hypothetical protein
MNPTKGALFGAIALLLAAPALAGGEKVAFPADFDKGVLYGSMDRPDTKQYREFYTSAAAVAAGKAGLPMPDGTVITMVSYKAKLGPDGNPIKDAGGRFIKDELAAYAVMEKRKGWGAEYAADVRNGEWEYQAFTAAKAVNDKANLGNCFSCHKPQESKDFLFTLDRMKGG